MSDIHYLPRGADRIAYRVRAGAGPGVLWLGGFKSDMDGTKAASLDAWAARAGRAFVRFDYFGHGKSSGDFALGTISRWREDALAVLDGLTEGPQILVGSSMGGWIALLAALARPERVAALLLIAPAPDFTEALMWAGMSPAVKREIVETGRWMRATAYDPAPYPVTRALIEDGRKHLLLGAPIPLGRPLRIVQGMQDPDVPWTHAMKLVERVAGDVAITLVKTGDHRMSSPSDIALIQRTLEGLVADVA